jgi:hypothetical protein
MKTPECDTALRGRLVRKDNPAVEITGTFERLTGVAMIDDAGLTAAGGLDFEYAGGTTIWWDEQRTAQHCGQRVFIDETGHEVLEEGVVVLLDDGRVLEPCNNPTSHGA